MRGSFDFFFTPDYLQLCLIFFLIFFFNDTATTEIYTLSLHDALPISATPVAWARSWSWPAPIGCPDRKSTRLNSSHVAISYAVFCLKKKKQDLERFWFVKKKNKKHNEASKRLM